MPPWSIPCMESPSALCNWSWIAWTNASWSSSWSKSQWLSCSISLWSMIIDQWYLIIMAHDHHSGQIYHEALSWAIVFVKKHLSNHSIFCICFVFVWQDLPNSQQFIFAFILFIYYLYLFILAWICVYIFPSQLPCKLP